MAPTKSTPAKATAEEQKAATPQEPQERAEPPAGPPDPVGSPAPEEPQERSSTVAEVGRCLWYRTAYGPAFALVTEATEGTAEVLVLRPDEVVKARTVAVYDSAEDAERAAQQGVEHVAWHPA